MPTDGKTASPNSRESHLSRISVHDQKNPQAEKYGPGNPHPHGGGLLSFDYAADLLRKHRLLRSASEEESHASKLRVQAEALLQTQSTIALLIGLLEQRRGTTA